MQLKGFVNINKPVGMTSSDVVVIVRGILRRVTGERQKVGHFGTLDPMASGVLPIAVGTATRLFDYAQAKTKIYQATFKFGEETDTLDRAGKVVRTSSNLPAKEQIVDAIKDFRGEIEQIPPQFSAKSVNGKRAYDLARAGKDFELKPKIVRIDSVSMIDGVNGAVTLKDGVRRLDNGEYAFEIVCGGGTYIRAIARDVASALGTVAYMSSLNRIKSGNFTVENAVSIEEFENSPLENLQDIDMVLRDFERLELPNSVRDKVLNGVKTRFDDLPKGYFVVTADGKPIGMASSESGILRIRTRL